MFMNLDVMATVLLGFYSNGQASDALTHPLHGFTGVTAGDVHL